ncbi:MAG: DM13 domain-containing protein [Halobacteria archaeon]|nr:DM13 domain-containing protein [Halobacteria archaeon]
MNKEIKVTIISAVAIVVLISGIVVINEYFLPEAATQVDEPQSGNSTMSAELIKVGEFSGKTGHHVSGTVKILKDDQGYYLRFEDYEQTQGPDVYVYLTPAEDPDTTSEIENGIKVLIDGGAEGGESTKVGNFNQRLPDNFDPNRYNGVAIWCDDFSVPFGAATLQSPS